MIDFHNDNYANEQEHLAPDLTEDYIQDPLSNLTESEQPWEQLDQTDDFHSDWNTTQEDFNYAYGESETNGNLYNSGLSESNIAYGGSDHVSLSSVYEQSTYSGEQSSVDIASNSRDYDSSLWEQQFEAQSNSSFPLSNSSTSINEQRSGHEPTSEDLQKANELDRQARQEETHYQDDSSWAQTLENENHPNAHLYHERAADHKAKAEDLQAEADKLRG